VDCRWATSRFLSSWLRIGQAERNRKRALRSPTILLECPNNGILDGIHAITGWRRDRVVANPTWGKNPIGTRAHASTRAGFFRRQKIRRFLFLKGPHPHQRAHEQGTDGHKCRARQPKLLAQPTKPTAVEPISRSRQHGLSMGNTSKFSTLAWRSRGASWPSKLNTPHDLGPPGCTGWRSATKSP
jgi:hypothetical protein